MSDVVARSDVYFALGATHTVCQDYAVALAGGLMVRLADGCSQAPHTDVGARLLCWSVDLEYDCEIENPCHALEFISGNCLLATLLEGEVSRMPSSAGRALCFAARLTGDGFIVARRRDGTGYTLIESHFPSGAPRYLAYDFGRTPEVTRARYLKEFGDRHVITTTEVRPGQPDVVSSVDYTLLNAPIQIHRFNFLLETYDLLVLLSDGAASFHRPRGINGATEPVPVREIVEEIIALKGTAGAFMLRRARKFLQEATKRGWKHDDDFSVAAIYAEQPEVMS